MRLDVKTLTAAWTPHGRREERSLGELPRLLDQPNERRRVGGRSGDLHLAALDAQFGQVRVVGQGLRQRFENHDRGRGRPFPGLQGFERLFRRRATPIHQFGAALGDPVLKIGHPGVIAAAGDEPGAKADHEGKTGQSQAGDKAPQQSLSFVSAANILGEDRNYKRLSFADPRRHADLVGPSSHCRARDRSDQRSRRSRDRNGDLSVARVGRLAPSEGGFVGGPRRQTIDLRADDAVVLLEVHHVIFATAVMAAGQIVFVWAALISGAVNIVLAISLVGRFGLLGIALAVAIAQLITNNWYVPFVAVRFFKISIPYLARKVWLPLILLIAAEIAADILVRRLPWFSGDSWARLIMSFLASTCIGLFFWMWLVLQPASGHRF